MADTKTKTETKTPADKPAEVYIVRAVNTVFDDKGKLRNPGDIFRTTRGGLIGRECVDAEAELTQKLDADQKAVEDMKKGDN